MNMADLERLAPEAVGMFGGKACGLARLISSGARVPQGFAVEATTALPDQWSDAEREDFRLRAAKLIDLGSLAVRSSAVGEDSHERSFAGLFETVLGAHTSEDALAGAARCIASGGSSRVLEYAKAESPLAVGLVVQSMVSARAAGVCFTRDPSGKDGAIVIEAVEGLGDKLVSGSASPERWRVYRSGLGGWESRVEDSSDVLGGAEAEQIAAEGSKLADQFGYPLDLEWALDKEGALWWLQARPITAAATAPSSFL